MIYLYTGTPGHGKTLFCLNDLYEWWKKDAIDKCKAAKEHEGEWIKHARPVYANRVNELAVPGWNTFEDPTKWHELPDHSLILIDECHKAFPTRPNGAALPEYVERLSDHRHRGIDLWLITQHPSSLDVFLKRRVEQHNHVSRKFGAELSTFYSWSGVCDTPEKSKKSAFKKERLFPKHVYNWYKSAEAHTHKFKLPREAWYFAAAVVVVPACFFGVVSIAKTLGFTGFSTASVTPGQSQVVSAPTGGGVASAPEKGAQGASKVQTAAEYLDSYTPRVGGLPHTAPVYAQLTTPQRVPVPAGCVATKARCTCYTQDATVLTIDDGLCRQIVSRGFFAPFDPDPQRSHQAVAAVSREQPVSADAGPVRLADAGAYTRPQGQEARPPVMTFDRELYNQ